MSFVLRVSLLLSSMRDVSGSMAALTFSTTVCYSSESFQLAILTFLGHAGAIVQARQLGDELYAGVHSDEAILANKGPTVMTLAER